MTRDGALAGMLVGSLVVLVWNRFGWFGVYEMIPGVALATLAIVGVSLLGRPPATSVDDTFTGMEEDMRAARGV
jgi:sodium/proline symporter